MIPQWSPDISYLSGPDLTLELAAALAVALALAALRFGDAILLKLKVLIRKIGREQEQGKGENKNRGGAPLHLETGGGPLQQPGGRRFSGPCNGAAAAPARRRRAGSSWSWGPCGRGSSSPARAEAAPAGGGHEWRRESRVGERDEQRWRLERESLAAGEQGQRLVTGEQRRRLVAGGRRAGGGCVRTLCVGVGQKRMGWW